MRYFRKDQEDRPPRPERREDIIHSREFSAERKNYILEYRENERGQFLRITEESRGKRNVLIIPSSGIDDFRDALDDLIEEVDRSLGDDAEGSAEEPAAS